MTFFNKLRRGPPSLRGWYPSPDPSPRLVSLAPVRCHPRYYYHSLPLVLYILFASAQFTSAQSLLLSYQSLFSTVQARYVQSLFSTFNRSFTPLKSLHSVRSLLLSTFTQSLRSLLRYVSSLPLIHLPLSLCSTA